MKKQIPPYILTKDSLSVYIDGESKILTSDHPMFEKAKKALKKGKYKTLLKLLDVKKSIEEFGKGNMKYKDGVVSYKDKPINNYLTRKIVQLQKEGFTIEPLLAFLENLQDNPSYRAREELYEFLEYGKLPITQDGYFIAYKKVNNSYKDIYTNTFDNSVGAICEMGRVDVDDNSARTCSAGLHFASREYMKHYGIHPADKIMAIKINPADVVAIPQDYNNTKGRCCKYEVIAELGSSDSFDTLEEKAVFEESLTKKTDKVIGAYYDKARGRWKAQLPFVPTDGKGSRHLGYFDTKEEAIAVTKKALQVRS